MDIRPARKASRMYCSLQTLLLAPSEQSHFAHPRSRIVFGLSRSIASDQETCRPPVRNRLASRDRNVALLRSNISHTNPLHDVTPAGTASDCSSPLHVQIRPLYARSSRTSCLSRRNTQRSQPRCGATIVSSSSRCEWARWRCWYLSPCTSTFADLSSGARADAMDSG